MGGVSNTITTTAAAPPAKNCLSSDSTLVNPPTSSSSAAPLPPGLDLNSPPPSRLSSSRASSSSSSSSSPPQRMEAAAVAAAASASAAAEVDLSPTAATGTVTPALSTVTAAASVAAPTASKKAGAGSTAQAEAEAIKQQLAATTFIQADVRTFREVVQRHTGAAEDAQDKMPVTIPARQCGGSKPSTAAAEGAAAAAPAVPHGAAAVPRRHASRLHERKQGNLRNLDVVNRGSPFKRAGCSPRGASDVSPKLVYGDALHTASAAGGLLPSPVTPLSSEASFETSNPLRPQLQPPLTPTELLRQSFDRSLHCSDDLKAKAAAVAVAAPPPVLLQANGGGGGVLERFPFHHHGMVLQPQPAVSAHFQLGSPRGTAPAAAQHHHHQHFANQHFVFEQQQQLHEIHALHHHQHHHHQREPELLDLFPIHSSSLKDRS